MEIKKSAVETISTAQEKVMSNFTIPRDVIARSVELTKQNGGSTISLRGEIPTEGFSFAPSKATEISVPVDQFNEKILTDYCGMMYDRFQGEGAHIGTWDFEGKTYMDVSRVVLDEQQAVKDAIKSNQIGIYDLKAGKDKRINDYQRQADGSYLYKGKDTGTIPETSNRPASEGWLSPSRIGKGIVITCRNIGAKSKTAYQRVLSPIGHRVMEVSQA